MLALDGWRCGAPRTIKQHEHHLTTPARAGWPARHCSDVRVVFTSLCEQWFHTNTTARSIAPNVLRPFWCADLFRHQRIHHYPPSVAGKGTQRQHLAEVVLVAPVFAYFATRAVLPSGCSDSSSTGRCSSIRADPVGIAAVLPQYAA